MDGFLFKAGYVFSGIVAFELLCALLLTGLPAFGKFGQRLSTYLCHAPGLDGVISMLIWVPWVLSAWIAGWVGLGACLLGQIVALQSWIAAHERLSTQHRPPTQINAYLDQRFGWWRNQLALWVTAVVLPLFFGIRLAQLVVYPWLSWILGFKAYDHSEWINVSRHKFEGLIGRDLIWCLYCDWMTGVYALGAEMLRNVESFWCPIRFYYDKKCENCSVDFPDINAGWVAADGSLETVVQTLDQQLARDRTWSWFADPDRPSRKAHMPVAEAPSDPHQGAE